MISTTADAGLLGRLADNTASLRGMLNAALEQQSSGKNSSSYAGLGGATRTSLDLRPALQHHQVWQDNIDRVSGQLEVTQSALKGVSSIAADFYARTNTVNQIGVSQVSTLATAARMALVQVAQLLNTKSGDSYVFAGQDTATPPVPDTDPAVLTAALLASDTATAPFSATLGTAVPSVEVGEGQVVQAGLLANRNTLATSAAPTTGSFLRDVMRSLASLGTLTDSGAASLATAAEVRTRLSGAITAMANEAGSLGDVQASLAARKTALATLQITLSKQVSNAEEVDQAAVLTRISALQTQLQASYQVIAGVRDLSLTKYL